VPETVGKDVETVSKGFATAALGTVLPENFFSAKDLCREPGVQTLGKVSAESPRRAVGGKK
jgi:hypothetical protein